MEGNGEQWLVHSDQRWLGGLVPTPEVRLPQAAYPEIAGGDFDSDGLLDLAFSTGRTIELWLNRGEDGFETILQLSDSYFIGLADGDGDGDVDLFVGSRRASAGLGWPGRTRTAGRRRGLLVSVAGGGPDEHPQDGQNRIGSGHAGDVRQPEKRRT